MPLNLDLSRDELIKGISFKRLKVLRKDLLTWRNLLLLILLMPRESTITLLNTGCLFPLRSFLLEGARRGFQLAASKLICPILLKDL